MPKSMRAVRNTKNIPAMLLIDLAYAIYSHTNAGKYIDVGNRDGRKIPERRQASGDCVSTSGRLTRSQ